LHGFIKASVFVSHSHKGIEICSSLIGMALNERIIMDAVYFEPRLAPVSTVLLFLIFSSFFYVFMLLFSPFFLKKIFFLSVL